MIGTSARPSSSSAARITPTRPSIMSLGAITSAPARAWLVAVRASSSSEPSLSTVAVVAQQAAVAVARVLAQAHVGDHEQVGVGVLDGPRGELDDALVVPGARALVVLVGRDAEEQHAGQPERARLARLGHGLRDRQALHAGHRPDRRAPAALLQAGLDEQRQDEVGGLQARLAHEVAQHRGAAQAAQARVGKGHAPMVTAGSPAAGRMARATAPHAGRMASQSSAVSA